jgi:hypothetical protein
MTSKSLKPLLCSVQRSPVTLYNSNMSQRYWNEFDSSAAPFFFLNRGDLISIIFISEIHPNIPCITEIPRNKLLPRLFVHDPPTFKV